MSIFWHEHKIRRHDRIKLTGKKNFVIWMTGLSGSGKSTIAGILEEMMHKDGYLTYILDGDNIRHGLNRDLGFSIEDRKENLRRVAEVARLMYDAGISVIVAFISPLRESREYARKVIGEGFVEVYVKAPLEVCKQRDPKGLYKKALAGEIRDFTGISSPYEEPTNPDLVVETNLLTPEESAKRIYDYVLNRFR